MANECTVTLTGNHFCYQKIYKSIFKFAWLMLEFLWSFTDMNQKKNIKDEN